MQLHRATVSLASRKHAAMESPVSDRDYTTSSPSTDAPRRLHGHQRRPRLVEETIAGPTHEVGDEFTHWSRASTTPDPVTELLPGKRVVWQVLDNWMSFIDDQSSGRGRRSASTFRRPGRRTEVRFTHVGLTPRDQCFDVCRDAWGLYVNDSLPSLITTGVGRPSTNPDEAEDGRVAEVRRRLASARS
jgi:hypothetical protein